MYAHREVYLHAPLALVAAEMRFSYAPRLKNENAQDQIQEALGNLLPIRRQSANMVIQFGGPAFNSTADSAIILLDRAATISATITTQSVSIETTTYSDYEKFRLIVSEVFDAIGRFARIPAVERLGLRYIDEIRVPEKISDAKQWSSWVNPKLVAALDVFANASPSFQGVAQLDRGNERRIEARWAALNQASTVGSDPLRRELPSPGPFFLLDVDSYWSAASPSEAQEFDLEAALKLLDELHDPIGSTFQSSLTEQARELFRGNVNA